MQTLGHVLSRSTRIRRSPDAGRCYRLRDCLHDDRTVEVPAEGITAILSAWLAELGVTSPLVQELGCAVCSGDWPATPALAERLFVEVAVAV